MTVQFVTNGGLSVNVPDAFTWAVVGKMTKGGVAQIIADLATATVTFDAETYDVGACVDIANERFVAPVAGKYLISVIIEWAATVIADGLLTLTVAVNGAANVTATQKTGVVGGSAFARSNALVTTLDLAAGTLVTFLASPVSGAPQSITKGEATFQRVA